MCEVGQYKHVQEAEVMAAVEAAREALRALVVLAVDIMAPSRLATDVVLAWAVVMRLAVVVACDNNEM